MYRKNIDNNDIQSIEFSTFKKKNTQIISQYNQDSFTILRNVNSLPIGLVALYLLKNQKSIPTFSLLSIQQVPRIFHPYQHQQTLNSIFNTVKNKIVSIESIVDLVNNYPIVQFLFSCYFRNITMLEINKIKNNKQTQFYQLMGNQQEVLTDYSMEIRGTLLNLAVCALGIDAKIVYGNSQIIQNYGNHRNNIKLDIIFNQSDKYIFNFSILQIKNINQRLNTPQQSTRNSKNFAAINKTISQDPISLRTHLQSRSVTKQNLQITCQQCNRKSKFCQCENKKRKGVTPKYGINSSSTISNNNFKSLFDGIMNSGISQLSSSSAFQQKKCKCNRSICRICKKK